MNRTLCLFLILILAAASIFVSPANAQTVATLHNFDDGSVTNDGITPDNIIEGRDGNFYGAAVGGGANGGGVLFKMTPSGTVTILTNLPAGFSTDDDDVPVSLTQGTDGNFYGQSENGGSAGYGAVFKLTPSGTFTILHHFGDGSVTNDGNYPEGGLTQGSDGNFYGLTEHGGTANGTFYRITPTGTETVLHNFGDGSIANDGQVPESEAPVLGADGDFYGITIIGGATATPNQYPPGDGTVFKITPSGVETVLYSFTGGNAEPYGTLLQAADGNFYGTTGFEDLGIIYKITPAGTLTSLYSFPDSYTPTYIHNYAFPISPLVQGPGDYLYGTTQAGGTNNTGTIFRISTGGTLTTLYNFSALSGATPGTNIDGANPYGPLFLGNDGNLYGTAGNGGTAGDGTIFRFNLSGTPLTIKSLSPPVISVGDPAFSLIIAGTNFTNNSTVTFSGTPVTVTARSASQLIVTVPASAITTLGARTVFVSDPTNGAASTIFTVVPGWDVQDVAAVSDGTARLLWDRSDGAAGIWVMSASNTETAVGPTYGPYQGWTAQDITAAVDGTSRILWNRYDGATGVWAMDARGNQISVSATYGPFSGWKAVDLATAPNGTSRLMWRYTNGEAGILTLNATGGEITVGRNYGPYTGWTATAVGAAGDGTARMLWTRSDGAMGLWSMDSGDLQKTVGPTYGPYSDSHGHWTATDLSTSADGTSNVLWKRSDGAIGVWTFSANNTMTTVGAVYGPYAGFTAAALDAANDKARVLWVRSDRAAGLWSFGSNDIESLIGPVYGPY